MVSVDEWAKSQGISRQAAYKRIQQHNIPLRNGKLNPAVADRIWSEFSNAAKQRGGQAGGEAAKAQAALFNESGEPEAPAAEEDQGGDALGEAPPAGMSRVPSVSEIQRAREMIAYRKAKYELEKLIGELIPADQPAQFFTELVAALKSELSNIGAELADALSKEDDTVECRLIVERRINKALENMAVWEPSK